MEVSQLEESVKGGLGNWARLDWSPLPRDRELSWGQRTGGPGLQVVAQEAEQGTSSAGLPYPRVRAL